jgi:hypothetical protein
MSDKEFKKDGLSLSIFSFNNTGFRCRVSGVSILANGFSLLASGQQPVTSSQKQED